MTVVVAVAELSALVGSIAAEVAVAVSMVVLSGAAVTLTFTTNISLMEPPEARLGTVQVTVPAVPGAGAVWNPLLILTLLKVVPQ